MVGLWCVGIPFFFPTISKIYIWNWYPTMTFFVWADKNRAKSHREILISCILLHSLHQKVWINISNVGNFFGGYSLTPSINLPYSNSSFWRSNTTVWGLWAKYLWFINACKGSDFLSPIAAGKSQLKDSDNTSLLLDCIKKLLSGETVLDTTKSLLRSEADDCLGLDLKKETSALKTCMIGFWKQSYFLSKPLVSTRPSVNLQFRFDGKLNHGKVARVQFETFA